MMQTLVKALGKVLSCGKAWDPKPTLSEINPAPGQNLYPQEPVKTPIMMILPGIQRIPGRFDPNGLLDRDSARKYAEKRGYEPYVLQQSGETGPTSAQVLLALRRFRQLPRITAIYGFSGGGYNVRHILRELSPTERARIKLIVVLGAPRNPRAWYQGAWELVYRNDPPTGHMDGPAALLREQSV